MSTRVFVTGMGVVSSLGIGRRAFWSSLLEGRSGTSEIDTFDTSSMGRSLAAQVKSFHPKDHLREEELRRAGRCSQMALAAARMAVEDARVDASHLASRRVAVVLGTTMGEADKIEQVDSARDRKSVV